MPLSINVGLSKKASRDFQSTGYSIKVTAELDQSLLAKPDELQRQIGDLYSQAAAALNQQAGASPAPQSSQNRRQPQRSGLAGTNNAAERARPAVVARKISGGGRSDNGAQAWATLASLRRTAGQQGQRVKSMLIAAWASEKPPTILTGAA